MFLKVDFAFWFFSHVRAGCVCNHSLSWAVKQDSKRRKSARTGPQEDLEDRQEVSKASDHLWKILDIVKVNVQSVQMRV